MSLRGKRGTRKEGKSEKKSLSYEDFEFRSAEIEKVVAESPKVKSFHLKLTTPRTPLPGQFMMVWLPSGEEVPMSVSDVDGGTIRISVAKAGGTTTMLHRLTKGDTLFARGPFGNNFSLDANSYLLVGGGYGAAPLIYAGKLISKSGKRGMYLVGAKNASELLFIREARKLGLEVHVATEDGSAGHRGFVTDLLDRLLGRKRFGSTLTCGPEMPVLRPARNLMPSFESILTCGPERMMYEAVREGVKRGICVQASLERYMKCGFGICGSCVLDPIGLRVCVDGPVFDGAMLLKTEFGKRKRDASGAGVRV